ncbi:MAG: hypothetical protein ACR2KK_18120 [Acidimicrobiales bacterium]
MSGEGGQLPATARLRADTRGPPSCRGGEALRQRVALATLAGADSEA